MNTIDFFLGMAACAVIVGVWRVIKTAYEQDKYNQQVEIDNAKKHQAWIDKKCNDVDRLEYLLNEFDRRLNKLERKKR
jgi:type II secretory pathway component PulM